MPVVELCPICWKVLKEERQSRCHNCGALVRQAQPPRPVPIERTEPRILTLEQIAEQLSPFEAAACANMITTVTSP